MARWEGFVMKRLIAAVLLFAGVWAGYWWFGITALRNGITQGLAQTQGHVSVADWHAQGFPSRFDLEITQAELRGPNWRWQVPQAEVMAMAWAPTKLIVWAGTPQVLTLYGQDIAIDAKDMRANVDFKANTSLPLEKLVAVFDAPQIGTARADQARLALQLDPLPEGAAAAPMGGTRYRIGGAINSLTGATASTDPASRADLTWDAHITLPVALDKAVLETGLLPRPQAIDLTAFTAEWSGARMTASGQLSVLSSGYLDGPLDLEIEDPARFTAALRESAVLPEDQIRLIEKVLSAIRSRDGGVTLPLTFTRGQTVLAGLFPLGPAPRLP